MIKILFLPFLTIPSGHHHVADCIIYEIEQNEKNVYCEKVDILSYSYGKIEKLISTIYLQWIHKLPTLYSVIYRMAAVNEESLNKRFHLYEWLFLNKIHDLVKKKNPDMIICTHALPSNMLNELKKRRLWSGIVMNIYTDYFINNLWGIENIDYHFVPSLKVKQQLIKHGVHSRKIFITGIPIHPLFKKEQNQTKKRKYPYFVILSGGNMGAGALRDLLSFIQPSGLIHYYVLCGKNKKLLSYVKRLHNPFIHALSYITSKEEMNHLYDLADAIITKPGGVTISECLTKGLPIFVHDTLPGQEEQNLRYLEKERLVYRLRNEKSIENQVLSILQCNQQHHLSNIDRYNQQIDLPNMSKFLHSLFIKKQTSM